MATIERRRIKRGISFRVEWRHSGERHRMTFPTEQEAVEWKNLIEAAGGNAEQADRALLNRHSQAPLLSEVAAEHIERLIDVTPYTKTKYRQAVARHFPRLDVPVDQITEDDVVRWVAWMSEAAPNGKQAGYSPKTIQNSHGLLHSVLGYAVRRGHRAGNPADGTRLPKVLKAGQSEKFLTIEEVAALLPHVPERHGPAIRFLFATGLRVGEMLALRPEDFTVAQGVAQVRVSRAMKQTAEGKGAYVGEPKTERSRRTVDVDDDTMAHVWPLVRSAGHGNPVFPAGPVRLSDRFWKIAWKPTITRAQAAGFTKNPGLHSLRHSHAAHMLSLGMPIHELSWRLGHSSIQVTIDRYGHLVPARAGTASRLFQESSGLLGAGAPAALTNDSP